MLGSYLSKFSVMGINARNSDYIFPNNKRRLYPLVDDKLQTKQLAEDAGIQVPELYGMIEFQSQAKHIAELAAPHKEFALKPAQGSGGGGIIVVRDIVDSGFVKSNGTIISHADMRYHVSNILSGMYSLGGVADKAIVEYAVKFDPVFDNITYQGVPDVRIIVYRGVPAMAMLRLPTRASEGKANLHKGGLGVGVTMADGVTHSAVQFNKYVTHHPETRQSLMGHTIPHWRAMLEMAATFYDVTGLGYLGVDLVLDKDKGPMLLELNARPGISIQIANQTGLLERTHKIDAHLQNLHTLEEKVAFCQEAFN